nr:MAG TPA: hypothetical protein [Crassvirales sp.]
MPLCANLYRSMIYILLTMFNMLMITRLGCN